MHATATGRLGAVPQRIDRARFAGYPTDCPGRLRHICAFALLALTTLSCSPSDDALTQQNPTAHLFAAARRTLTLPAFTPDVVIVSDAHVVGPTGSFRTEVVSGARGLVRMVQTSGFLGGVDEQGPWTLEPEQSSPSPLTAEGLAMIRGHELHMLALYPEQRARESRLIGRGVFGSDSALVVRHTLDTSHELLAYYAARDTVPLGFEVAWLDPVVTIRLADWRALGTAQVFWRAEFQQGGEVFVYYYDLIELESRTRDTFRRDAAMARRGVR